MSTLTLDDHDLVPLWYRHAGVDLFASTSGHGRPLVLCHGGLATHLACRRFTRPLAGRGQVITPDLRGSGRSRFAGPLSWALLADDIAALLDAIGAERAVVGGVSFGAGVAVATALHHPDRVAALLVLHPAYGGAELGLTATQQAAMTAMADAGARTLTEGPAALLPLFAALPAPIRARAAALIADYDPASVAAATAFMGAGAQPFARGADLGAITTPTLLVPGVDPQHPPAVADVYRRHLPRCAEAAAEVDGLGAAIAAFLDGLATAS
jgi:3-oxoadipate enol-lactonase